MKVQVVGKSKATSKEGNAFTVVHLVSPFKNGLGEGSRVENPWLNSQIWPYDSIRVGAIYDFDRDQNGFVIGFEYLEEA